MSEKVLEIKNLSKSFGSKNIINNLSLSINSGEICGFLGPNGSGKTTTIKMIVGLLLPDSGTVSISGHDITTDFEAAMENVGAIVENPDMHRDLSGRLNLELSARMYGTVTKERIDECIKLVGLENRINDKVKKYSLGMKQRLGVAMALLNKPKLLIFDEPTNGLDPQGIKDFRDTVKKAAHEDGCAVFVSSHMMSEMEQLCDKVAIIEKGRIIGIKDVQSIINGGESKSFRIIVTEKDKASAVISENFGDIISKTEDSKIGEIDSADVEINLEIEKIPEVIKKLCENDVSVYGVTPVEGKLEDAFINITGGNRIE